VFPSRVRPKHHGHTLPRPCPLFASFTTAINTVRQRIFHVARRAEVRLDKEMQSFPSGNYIMNYTVPWVVSGVRRRSRPEFSHSLHQFVSGQSFSMCMLLSFGAACKRVATHYKFFADMLSLFPVGRGATRMPNPSPPVAGIPTSPDSWLGRSRFHLRSQSAVGDPSLFPRFIYGIVAKLYIWLPYGDVSILPGSWASTAWTEVTWTWTLAIYTMTPPC
jgi:hypothetical protein